MISKWAGSPLSLGALTSLPRTSPTADSALVEDELGGSSGEDTSIEVISPPRRPVTRSVSAKRAVDEMELEDNDRLSVSPSPRPRKVRRVVGTSSECVHRSFPVAGC